MSFPPFEGVVRSEDTCLGVSPSGDVEVTLTLSRDKGPLWSRRHRSPTIRVKVSPDVTGDTV